MIIYNYFGYKLPANVPDSLLRTMKLIIIWGESAKLLLYGCGQRQEMKYNPGKQTVVRKYFAGNLYEFVKMLPSGSLLGSFGDDEPGNELVMSANK